MAYEEFGFLSPADSFGPTASFVIASVIGASVTLPWLFACWRFAVYRKRTADAVAATKKPNQKMAGPVLLHGRVETDDEAPAVRIAIDQTGQEFSNKGNYSFRWTEQERALTARPFRLRMVDGDAVTVDPEGRVALVDTLETEKLEGTSRRRVAELSHGEEVWVSGVVTEEGATTKTATAYRTQPGSKVLRGTRMEPVAVASGGFEARFSYWRDFYSRSAIILGIVGLLANVAFTGSYVAKRVAGKVETATITKLRTYTTSGKSGPVPHYEVRAKLSDAYGGAAVDDEVSRADYDTLQVGGTQQVPFLVVPSFPSIHCIGRHADLGILTGVFGLMTGSFVLLFFGLARSAAMPWYEQRKVVERGPGHLADKAYDKQVPGKRGLYEPGRPA